MTAQPATDPAAISSDEFASRRGSAALLAVGTATPPLQQQQEEIAAALESHWQVFSARRDRWRRIVAGSGVAARYGIVAIEQILRATTSERMCLYQLHAPDLAERAALAALDSAGVAPHEITDLIVVSCTGFFAPGIDVSLVDRLALPRTVRRNTIGFMGCFGAMTGLRAAIGACAAARRDATALVVCVELCSLHLRDSVDDDNLVASALFGDGAAAAVVRRVDSVSVDRRCAQRHGTDVAVRHAIGLIDVGGSCLSDGGRSDMTWRITDHGYAMTIDPCVPRAIEALVIPALHAAGIDNARQCRWIVHPGGPRILDAVEAALDLAPGSLNHSREILRTHGNMSSATVLFVLEDIMAAGPLPCDAALLAFGPGLTIEVMPIRPSILSHP